MLVLNRIHMPQDGSEQKLTELAPSLLRFERLQKRVKCPEREILQAESVSANVQCQLRQGPYPQPNPYLGRRVRTEERRAYSNKQQLKNVRTVSKPTEVRKPRTTTKVVTATAPQKWFVNEMYMRVMNNEKVKQEPKKTLQEGRYEPGTIRVKNHQGATRT